MKALAKKINKNIIVLVVVLVAVFAILSQFSPFFLTGDYLLNMTRFIGERGLITLGMTLVIVVGGMDLSVGSMVGLSAVIFGMCMTSGIPAIISIVIALLVGVAGGALNGILVCKLKIAPLIITLATMSIFGGLALGLSGGDAIALDKSLGWIGQGDIFGIPNQFVLMIVVFIVMSIILRKTNMGINLRAIGNNEEAALFSGINVTKEKTRAYILSSFFSAMVGVLFACRVISCKSDFGDGYEMDAITMAAFGGAALSGGKYNLIGAFIATIIIVAIRLGLTLGGITADEQSVYVGLVLIISVAVTNNLEARRNKRESLKA